MSYLLSDDFDSDGYTLGATLYQPVQLLPGYVYTPDGTVPTIDGAGYQSAVGQKLYHNIYADGSALPDADMLIWAKATATSIVAADWPRVLTLSRVNGTAYIELGVHTSANILPRVFDGTQIITVSGAFPLDTEVTLYARYASGSWDFGKYVGGVLTSFGAPQAKTMPTGITRAVIGNLNDSNNAPWRGAIADVRIKLGTFANDAALIAAFDAAAAEVAPAYTADPFAVVSGPTTVNGLQRYVYRSEYTDSAADYGDTYFLDVLAPDDYDAGTDYPLVIVLGVEATPGGAFADEMQVILGDDLHNTVGAVFCRVTTKSVPWWARKSDGTMDYEALIRDGVLPWMRDNYSIRAGRFGVSLLGYSKGGWGAMSLMLRNPTAFGFVALWDAPLTANRATLEENGADFGSDAEFEARSPGLILADNVAGLTDQTRVIYSGVSYWTTEYPEFKALLDSEAVPYNELYAYNPVHDSDAGWMPSVVEALAAIWIAPTDSPWALVTPATGMWTLVSPAGGVWTLRE